MQSVVPEPVGPHHLGVGETRSISVPSILTPGLCVTKGTKQPLCTGTSEKHHLQFSWMTPRFLFVITSNRLLSLKKLLLVYFIYNHWVKSYPARVTGVHVQGPLPCETTTGVSTCTPENGAQRVKHLTGSRSASGEDGGCSGVRFRGLRASVSDTTSTSLSLAVNRVFFPQERVSQACGTVGTERGQSSTPPWGIPLIKYASW